MTERAVYAGIPIASDAGRLVRALQENNAQYFHELARAIGTQQSEASAAIKQLAARGLVQIRHAYDGPIVVLTPPAEVEPEPEIIGYADGRKPSFPGVKERVFDYLELRRGKWKLTSAIATALDIPERRVRQRLRELEVAGLVERRKKHNDTGHIEIEWKAKEVTE